MEQIAAEEEERYPDHCKDSTDGAKNSLGGCDTRDLLGEIQSLDGRVQR